MECKNTLSLLSSRTWKYDVFVNFRGEDTRRNFTSHLLAALKRQGLRTFIDDDKGDDIKPRILQAIEQSRISIALFSRNFADSPWCLMELAKMVECHETVGQIVWPVFYHVDPYDVRDEKGDYGEVLNEHEEKSMDDSYRLRLWRTSLTKVASLRGWNVKDRLETEVIDEIVKMATRVSNHKFLGVADDLVGMESRVEALENLMGLDSDGVRVVGICGMGGIGKTSLARVVYERNFYQFDACCFLSNVSEVSTKHNGLYHLQEKLIRYTLELDDLKIRGGHEGAMLLRTRLQRLKILLVLDDVDHSEQIEKLAGSADWFGIGSRIIITTRDEHILKRFGLGNDEIYKAEPLKKEEALELFGRKASKCDCSEREYEELTSCVLEYANGLPLAIQSLASSLLKVNASEWRSTLSKLQKVPDHWIMKVLRRSFDGLPHLEKEVFLDIACFFVGEDINYVKEILKYYRFDPEIGIKILIEKSLMTISDQKICMHDMIQQMGRLIVQQESPDEPGKRSRLWYTDDFRHVMEKDTATTNIEAIVLNQKDLEGTPLEAKAFSKMTRLKLLIIQNVNFSGSLKYLSKSLCYLSWIKYPFTYLPSNFEPHKLVELNMPSSNIKQLWEGIKMLPNLRSMNLRDSKDLLKTPDFRGVPNLERLDLEGCTALLQIDISIIALARLTFLNLRNCTSLVIIPNKLLGLHSIEILNLAGCSNLVECLNFNPLRSLVEVKLLSNQYIFILYKIAIFYCCLFSQKI